MGRKLLLTEKMIKEIANKVGCGLRNDDACLACGISRRVFYDWLAQAKAETPSDTPSIYQQLLEAMEIAEAAFKETHLARIDKASKTEVLGTWTASAWLLERKFPGEFSRRQQIAITDKLDEFVKAFDEIK